MEPQAQRHPIIDARTRIHFGLSRALLAVALFLGPLLLAPATEAQLESRRAQPLALWIVPEGLLYRIVTTDGTELFGRIVSEGDPVRVGLAIGGVEEIPRERIVRIERVRGSVVDGEYWFEDTNHTRLFFAPTGRTLPQGSGTVNAYYGVLPFVAIGVTPRFSLAGGTPLGGLDRSRFPVATSMKPDAESLPGTDDAGRLVYLAPKLRTFSSRHVDTAVGVLAFFHTHQLSRPVGTAYGVATWSPTDRSSVTTGAGWSFAQGGWESTPALMVGADHRLARRVKVVGESYRFPSQVRMATGGVRLLGGRAAVDLAAGWRDGGEGGRFFPLVNVSFGW